MNSHAFKAGLFIIASVVAALLMIAFMGKPFGVSDRDWTLRFDLERGVGGLQAGDDVRLGGVRLGRVEDVSIEQEDGKQAYVRVVFSLPDDYVLRQKANITIQSQVTGVKWVEIRDLGEGEPLTEGSLIAGGASDFNRTFDEIARILPEMRDALTTIRTQSLPQFNALLTKTAETVEDVRGVVIKTGERIEPTLDRFDKLADNGAAALGDVRDLLGQGKGDLRQTIASISTITRTTAERLPDLLDRTGKTLDEFQRAGAFINESAEELNEVVTNTRDATAGLKSLLTDNRPTIDSILTDLKQTSTEGKNLIGEIRRSPWRLLYRPSRAEQDNLDLYASARRMAESAQQVHEAALTLRVVSSREGVDKDRLDQLVKELEQQLQSYSDARSVFFERLRSE